MWDFEKEDCCKTKHFHDFLTLVFLLRKPDLEIDVFSTLPSFFDTNGGNV